jgi:hypothetical protein
MINIGALIAFTIVLAVLGVCGGIVAVRRRGDWKVWAKSPFTERQPGLFLVGTILCAGAIVLVPLFIVVLAQVAK